MDEAAFIDALKRGELSADQVDRLEHDATPPAVGGVLPHGVAALCAAILWRSRDSDASREESQSDRESVAKRV